MRANELPSLKAGLQQKHQRLVAEAFYLKDQLTSKREEYRLVERQLEGLKGEHHE